LFSDSNMSFLNIPLKSVQLNLISVVPSDTMPWYNPALFPVAPGNPEPSAQQNAYRWILTCDVSQQLHSSNLSRQPGAYNGQDISVGQWIANASSGAAWQIISVVSKTTQSIQFIVQDIYRYNTYRDVTQQGDGSPPLGYYVAFSVSDSGVPQIDPIPEAGVSANFFTNLLSRFEYINLQYDFPLYQSGNGFQNNDVIGTDVSTHSFALASTSSIIPVGRITSISDTIIGWFTINPVQKITDFLDNLPGQIGDIIYTDPNNPGGLTLTPGGSQIYLKIRNNTNSISYSNANSSTTPGNVFQLNDIDVVIGGASGNLDDLVTAIELVASQTGVHATKNLVPSTASTTLSLSPLYGEILLNVTAPYPAATINGTLVTFNISSSDAGYVGYSRAVDMKTAINNANIPNITATTIGAASLVITNSTGGSITIVNTQADINGVSFSGNASGSGVPTFTTGSSDYRVTFIAIDSRPINFLDVVGSPTGDYGLISVENGIKACGMYIAEGIRTSTSVVVSNLAALNSLAPYLGDQAYVINSDDSQGNHVGEWSMWLFDGASWVQTSNQDSATTDAKSLEYTLTTATAATINIGEISTGRRVTLITVEVTTPFNGPATLSIGYQVSNPTLSPPPVPEGLMVPGLIDLTVAGTYTTYTDVLFGTDTAQGDVTIRGTFDPSTSTLGSAQIIVSYV
jgi:hypothetical protein